MRPLPGWLATRAAPPRPGVASATPGWSCDGFGFPHSWRAPAVAALTGFQSAMACSHPGMCWVGTSGVGDEGEGEQHDEPERGGRLGLFAVESHTGGDPRSASRRRTGAVRSPPTTERKAGHRPATRRRGRSTATISAQRHAVMRSGDRAARRGPAGAPDRAVPGSGR